MTIIPLALVAAGLCAPAAAAQQSSEEALAYRREVFEYPAEGRRDPFRPLLNSTELGVRLEDLTLLGIVYHPDDPGASVAVLEHVGRSRRYRVRMGERVGPIRVLAVNPRSVDVIIEELGVARRETLVLRRRGAERSES